MGMTDGLQQSFPLSQSPLFIPLALEGHAGARPEGFAKVTIAGELENAFHKRFTVTGRNRKAATILFENASDLAMFGADKRSSGDRRRQCRRICSAQSDPPIWG